MKVVEKIYKGEYDTDTRLEIEIDGQLKFSVGEGEPEDMILCRDLSGVYNIMDLIVMAYNAGKSGETLNVERIEEI